MQHSKKSNEELSNEELSADLTAMVVAGLEQPNRSPDAFSMRFSTAYASGEEEMAEWDRILHPDRMESSVD